MNNNVVIYSPSPPEAAARAAAQTSKNRAPLSIISPATMSLSMYRYNSLLCFGIGWSSVVEHGVT